MIANYNMVIDFARPTKSNTIVVSEYDANTRNCNFKLLFDKQPFDMTGVVSAIVKATTSQGTIVFGEATIHEDSEGNYINELSYLLPAQITDTAGNTTMTIELQDNVGGRITSFEFYIKVRNALYNEDDYIDDDDLEGFRDLLQRSQAALAAMEEMVTQDALPNPYPLRINGIDDYDLEYKGDDLVQFVMDEVAYLGTTSGTVTTTEDDSAAAVAVAAAEAAEASAEDAEETKQDVITYFENFQSQIPTVSVEKVDHTATVTITDREGSSTADIYDGDKGDKGDKGDAATVAVGTVTTGEPGTDASVVNSGTSTDAVFDFTIPRGASAVADLNELTDVTITSPSNGQILAYDGDDSEWVNRSVDSTPTSGSSDLVTSGGVYTSVATRLSRVENDQLGAKNLLPSGKTQTISGVTFTVDKDGYVKANGTNSSADKIYYPIYPADGSYVSNKYVNKKLSGCTGGSSTTYYLCALYSSDETTISGEDPVYDGEITIPLTISKIRFAICICGSQSVSNKTFSPLLRLSNDPYNGYVPYAMTNRELTIAQPTLFPRAEQKVLGARNLLPIEARTQTINNITFTIYSDGSVKAHGTNSSSNNTLLHLNSSYMVNNFVGMKLSGCTGGSGTTYFLSALYSNNGTAWAGETDIINGEEKIIENYPYIRFCIAVGGGKSVSNQMFYPMIRMASDSDPSFSPNTMTNKHLTDILTKASYVTSGLSPLKCTINCGGYYKLGNIVIVVLRVTTTENTLEVKVSGFPSYSKTVSGVGSCVGGIAYGPSGTYYYINTSGELICSASLNSGTMLFFNTVYICD